MKVLRWIGVVVAALVVAIALVFVGARFADGPLGMIPGGALRSGALVEGPDVDWTFAADVPTIELQLVDPERSRTVWLVVHAGQLYVPCSLDFPPFKTWHTEALADGRAVLRVGGKRYERRLERVTDEALLGELAGLAAEKYDLQPGGRFDPSRIWIFRVAPRGDS